MSTPENAYRQVRTALERGMLKRAQFCSRCGVPDIPASDGRSTIHAHHLAGYNNPLLVEWLCAACHRDETPLPEVMGAPVFGEKNGQAKLTVEAVQSIRHSRERSSILAAKFGVSRWTIARVRSGQYWIAAAPPVKEG